MQSTLLELPADATRGDLLRWAAAQLREASIASARRNAEWIVGEVLGCGRAHLYAYPDKLVETADVARVETMVARRRQREPLQYVLGHADFFGLRLRVTPHVLIPRPETEQVVEAALQQVQDREAPAVLDVGTGSGCIALGVKHERPAAVVTACDVSTAALKVARSNASSLGLDVAFVQTDVLDPACTEVLPHGADLIISNPPYVPDEEAATLAPEVREHEPHAALFSGADPLRFYRAITQRAARLLAPEGCLVFEVHADYGQAVAELLEHQRYRSVHLERDLSGRDRIVWGRRCPGGSGA